MVLGHRGGRGEGWPAENSLAAFARAIAEGADGVELDVRLTADGVPVVFHDPWLARGSAGAAAPSLARMTAAELPRLADGEPIPRLVDALDALRGHVVNVEIKTDVAAVSLLRNVPDRVRLVQATVAAVNRAPGAEVLFSSFDPLVVTALAAMAPRVPRAILVDVSMARAATAVALAMRPVIVAAHLHDRLLTPVRVERLTRAGLRLGAWAVQDPARALELVALGVRWLITDAPAVLVSALRP